MGAHPKTRVTVAYVAVLVAASGVCLAHPSPAPAALPPAWTGGPALLGPAAIPVLTALAATLWAESLASAASPLAASIDAGERDPLPNPIPEISGGGDDPSGPWPAT